ncbi:MAG: ATP-binding protein [Dongiaceae bacterium]
MRTARRAAFRLLTLMLVGSVALPALLLGSFAWVARGEAQRAADERIDRWLDVLHEQALKVLQTSDLLLDQVASDWGERDDAAIRADEAALHHHLATMVQRLPQVQSIWLIDREGYPLASDYIYPVPRTRLSDRDYFAALVDKDPGLYVGAVLQPRLAPGDAFFSVSRRRPSADGSFNGVVEISLLPRDFVRFYAQLDGGGGFFALLREDGTVLARYPAPAPDAAGGGTSAAHPLVANAATDRLTMVTPGDGVERRIGFRRVAGYPVYVAAGVATAAIGADWHARVWGQLAFGLPATLVICGALALALQRTRRLYAEAERREAAEAALRQSQRLETLGQLTGGVAHDFNNLLMVISGSVQRLQRRERDARDARALEMIGAAARRGEALTRKLLAFARRQTLAAEPLDLTHRLPAMQELLRRSLRGDIEVVLDLPPEPCRAKLDPSELELAVLNLAVNARDAMPEGGRLTLALRRVTLQGEAACDGLVGDFLALAVSDTGAGIPEAVLPRVFEPFFTTKPFGQGTGLGLSQVYGFARQSGGTATIASRPGQGATVTLYLPVTSEQPVAWSDAAPPGPVFGGGRSVLLVEDDQEVAEVGAGFLDELGFRCHREPTGEAALALLRSGRRFDLVLSDILMPGGLNGLELAHRIRSEWPEQTVLLTTGYSPSAQQAVAEGFVVLRKPYDAAALRAALARLPGGAGRSAAAS